MNEVKLSFTDDGYTIEGIFTYDVDIESRNRTITLSSYKILDADDNSVTDTADNSVRSYLLKQLWYVAEEYNTY